MTNGTDIPDSKHESLQMSLVNYCTSSPRQSRREQRVLLLANPIRNESLFRMDQSYDVGSACPHSVTHEVYNELSDHPVHHTNKIHRVSLPMLLQSS
jgi:hypothetical protein